MADNAEWKRSADRDLLMAQVQRTQQGLDGAEASGESATAGFAWEASVASTLQRLRKTIGYSQAEVAERLALWGIEMHQTTLAKLEAGKRPLRLAELYALASIYRVTPGTVLFEADLIIDGSQDIDDRIAGFEAESAELRQKFVAYAETVFDLLRLQADSRAALVNVLKAVARSRTSPQTDEHGVDQTET